jgi:uncharacterized membrane protein YkoI
MIWRLSFVTGGVIAALTASLAATAVAQDKDEKIPKIVMDSLKAEFPKAEIVKWTKEKEADKLVYDIEFKQGSQKFEADIFENGSIHNWEKQIDSKDLPKAVRDTLDKKHPRAAIKEVMQITAVKDNKDMLEGYEVVFVTADEKEAEVTFAPDGKILEESTGDKKDKK